MPIMRAALKLRVATRKGVKAGAHVQCCADRNSVLKMIAGGVFFLLCCLPEVPLFSASAQQSQQNVDRSFDSIKRESLAPVVLCIDDKPLTGGQPSSKAYSKVALNGFRSVLTLRGRKDGVDVTRERFVVEQNNLRYFNIRHDAEFPDREQVDEFLKLARDPLNQPMLVNCAFAERIAPLMMMFRILEQGWGEGRAVEEASHSGLMSAKLKRFARDYLANGKKPVRKSAAKS